MGKLTREQLEFWFLDKGGAISTIGSEVLRGTEEWRQEYTLDFDKAVITKLADWQYEKEYRIVLHNPVLDLSSPPSIRLKYRFKDLQGIIFGLETSAQDRIGIMRLIEANANNRDGKNLNFIKLTTRGNPVR